jgi:glutamate racemase
MKIAFFDSGIGGLTVLHEAIKKLPEEQYVYFGDSLNAPYGTKTREKIKMLVFQAVDFLVKQHELKALVLACNTATSIVIDDLRKTYSFPIIGMEPAVKPAIRESLEKKVIVSATDLTLKEEKLRKLVKNLNATDKVDYLSLQGLVTFAENFDFYSPAVIEYLQKQFAGYDWHQYEALVLGCTHFIYYKNIIQELLPDRIQIIDGNVGTVKQLETQIVPNAATSSNDVVYYISGKKAESEKFEKYLQWLGKSCDIV